MSGEGEEPAWIAPGNGRRLIKMRGPRRFRFGKARQEAFLEHLAATCNVAASAEAAGVAVSTVYRARMTDAVFRARWTAALEQGYARLEAALLERAASALARPALRGDKAADGADAPSQIDWDRAMNLLAQHRRGLAGVANSGARRPQRVPIEDVSARLIRKLKALGVRAADDPGQ